jgi:hypothetical protein
MSATTKAISPQTPSRRALLGGTVALLAGVAVAHTPAASEAGGGNPDAELIRLCAAFHHTQAELQRWHATGWEQEPSPRETEAHRLWKVEDERFFYANDDAFAAVVDMPAKTSTGLVAKSKVLAVAMRHVIEDGDATPYESFAYKLAQEAAQITGEVA